MPSTHNYALQQTMLGCWGARRAEPGKVQAPLFQALMDAGASRSATVHRARCLAWHG
jgi:hypothetical protein